jgi:hypothetical protein
MKTFQTRYGPPGQWCPALSEATFPCQLALAFGSRALIRDPLRLAEIRAATPGALVIGCSTAGEICGERVSDESLVVTGVHFEDTRLELRTAELTDAADSARIGAALARGLPSGDLAHVFVLSDGLRVNGSALVAGLSAHLPPQVTMSGGMSGDGDRFQETWVLCDGSVGQGRVALLGLYGSRLRVGCASLGGWDCFGPERVITRSEGSQLYELDGKAALTLYKQYLGEHAAGLPATGLLFPLALRSSSGGEAVVRTILAVDERAGSLTFAGDVPRGSYARLMKANFDRLVEGAAGAARSSRSALGSFPTELAILISCVGRKMVLKQRIEEELEAVRRVLGPAATLAGFYSYGEISPFTPRAKCELHNQTMTITALSEAA